MEKPPYTKPPLTIDEQVELLMNRGMICADICIMKHNLSHFGYYRLSAYWYGFRVLENHQRLDNFCSNTKWEAVIRAYEFDRALRLLMMDAIERIEVAIRTKITYCFSHQYGAFGYKDSKNFHTQFGHDNWLRQIKKEINRSKESFVQHFNEKYQEDYLPIWMVAEIISLGNLSKLYGGLTNDDKKEIAKFFALSYRSLKNWLHVITYVRNVCAHHSRLFNKSLTVRFDKANNKLLQYDRVDKTFYVLLALQYLIQRLDDNSLWHKQVNELLDSVDENILTSIGAPNNYLQYFE